MFLVELINIGFHPLAFLSAGCHGVVGEGLLLANRFFGGHKRPRPPYKFAPPLAAFQRFQIIHPACRLQVAGQSVQPLESQASAVSELADPAVDRV